MQYKEKVNRQAVTQESKTRKTDSKATDHVSEPSQMEKFLEFWGET